jgi:hypothetical protein
MDLFQNLGAKPSNPGDQATIEKGVNFPTLQRVIGNTT